MRYAGVDPAIGHVSEDATGITVVVAAVVRVVVPVIRVSVVPVPIGIPIASVEADREPWTVPTIRIRPIPVVGPVRVEPACAGPERPGNHDTRRRDRPPTVKAPTPILRARVGGRHCGTRRDANES